VREQAAEIPFFRSLLGLLPVWPRYAWLRGNFSYLAGLRRRGVLGFVMTMRGATWSGLGLLAAVFTICRSVP